MAWIKCAVSSRLPGQRHAAAAAATTTAAATAAAAAATTTAAASRLKVHAPTNAHHVRPAVRRRPPPAAAAIIASVTWLTCPAPHGKTHLPAQPRSSLQRRAAAVAVVWAVHG